MTGGPPVLVWFRRDLRLSDHAALCAAQATGRPVIPVFIHDEVIEDLGAAPKWRFGLGVARFAESLRAIGTRLVLRRGRALQVLRALIAETGADTLFYQRAYDPASIARDTQIKAELGTAGITVQSCAGHLLTEPWTVATKTGGPFKVFTPFWRAIRVRDMPVPWSRVTDLVVPEIWPASEDLGSWAMGAAMRRGAEITGQHARVGEAAAHQVLAQFAQEDLRDYKDMRDVLHVDGTSDLSEPLTYGELSPAQIWQALDPRVHDHAEPFLRQLAWRDFAYHLLYHWPDLAARNWRRDWDGFPWSDDATAAPVLAWQQGRTGVPLVDAGLRQMYVTGRMHNRARMVVASYLTKHMLVDWRVGLRWFADCLTDWDPAANAMGWQWVAGCGPDAAPYFRIFNAQTQAERFDPDQAYVKRWIAELGGGGDLAAQYFQAVPRGWGLAPDADYPAPIVDHKVGRARALAAYETHRGAH